MRYVLAKEKEAFELKAYRIYVCDSLHALIGNENNPRYMDYIDKTIVDEEKIQERAEDIKERIKNKLKGGN